MLWERNKDQILSHGQWRPRRLKAQKAVLRKHGAKLSELVDAPPTDLETR
jgi:hypothetical protein